MFKRILIAVDAGEQSEWALVAGAELAGQLRARIGLVHVVNSTFAWVPELAVSEARIFDDLRKNGAMLIERLEERLPETILFDRIAREGEPAEEIIKAARDWRADLIVMGTHARRGLARVLIGSTAAEVLRHAPCPVLMIRQKQSSTNQSATATAALVR